MAETVECSECGTRYDSDEHPFCPRCGSTARGAAAPGAALAAAVRHDPGRRRVQASGAVFAAVGALLALLFVPMLFLAGPLTQRTLDQVVAQDPDLALPGGTLEVAALDNGTPLAGAPVNVTTPGGEPVANGTTGADGLFSADVGGHAVVHVAVDTPAGRVERKAVAMEGSTTRVRADAADGLAADGWTGLGPLLVVVRTVLAAFACVAGLLVAAGILAMRLRAWGFCVGAGAVGLLPALLLLVASPSVGFLLVLGVLAVPLGFIAAGRRHFARQA